MQAVDHNQTPSSDRLIQVLNSPIIWMKVLALDEPDDEVYEAYEFTEQGTEPTGVFLLK